MNAKHFLKLFIVSILTIFSLKMNAQSKKQIEQINKSIIFDLFINFELTQPNIYVPAIIDHIPTSDTKGFKIVNLKSDIGDVDWSTKIYFSKTGEIKSLQNVIHGEIMKYKFIYKKGKLAYFGVNGKKAAIIKYDKLGIIKSILRVKGKSKLVCGFKYDKTEKKFTIDFNITRDKKKLDCDFNYFVKLDDQYRIKDFFFNDYSHKNMSYDEQGKIKSFEFEIEGGLAKTSWNYTKKDNKENWVERESKGIYFTRGITYY
jgi:hypothetical protein